MLTATFWGIVGGVALLFGGLIGVFVKVSYQVIGLVMAFGSGVLISALAFELTQEAFTTGGAAPVVIGLVTGSLVFSVGDWLIDRRGGHRRKSPTVLGALLDGIPDSAAIGASVIDGGKVGLPIVAAVFLSNVPESMSASAGLKQAGWSTPHILCLWALVMVVSGVSAGAGYVLLEGASEVVVVGIQAFAAGAIITMLADTMMPEATEHAGRLVGLATMVGFTLAFLLGAVA